MCTGIDEATYLNQYLLMGGQIVFIGNFSMKSEERGKYKVKNLDTFSGNTTAK